VEVYWRHGFTECALLPTDRGWEVVLTVANGDPMRRERVTSSAMARLFAERWRQEDLASDQA
jgi:hypothetical protein